MVIFFKEDVNPYIAAAGHFGNQSKSLVKDYAKNLGFKYLTASNKEEFLTNVKEFLSPQLSSSYIFEVFTHDYNENEALRLIMSKGTIKDLGKILKGNAENIIGTKV